MTKTVYRDEVDNDMEGWVDEYGTLPAGWYRLEAPTRAVGPFKTRELADSGTENLT